MSELDKLYAWFVFTMACLVMPVTFLFGAWIECLKTSPYSMNVPLTLLGTAVFLTGLYLASALFKEHATTNKKSDSIDKRN